MSAQENSTASSLRLGVDLGGTKIEIIALDASGQELLRRRVATPQGDYQGTITKAVDLIEAVEVELGQRGQIGFGIPGAESLVNGLIKNANSNCLIGKHLRSDLQMRLHREIFIENDANCFVLSEAVDGAGQDASVVFGVILGTGVGGGVVAHGRVLSGVNRIAGEWGHNPLPYPEEETLLSSVCYCGRQGCIETWLSGPGMTADHQRHTGETVLPPTLVARAEQGDAACDATLRRYERRLAKALSGVINILDPDVIVLGGGLSNIDRFYSNIPELWKATIFSDQVRTRLCRNHHGDSSGVRGAAWLCSKG